MTRHRTVVVAVALLLVASVAAGWFVVGIGQESPGDCGLGTGGVYSVASNASATTVDSPAVARSVVDDEFEANNSRLESLAADRSAYAYVPREDVHDEFRDAVRSRDRLGEAERRFYFPPDGDRDAVGAYDRTLVVTAAGDLYVVRVGAC